MASALGMEVSLPYLDRSVVGCAKKLSPGYLVGSRRGKKFGKLILRVAFEDLVGRRIAWRGKTPIEYGSETTSLPTHHSAKTTEGAFNQGRKSASRDGVKNRDQE